MREAEPATKFRTLLPRSRDGGRVISKSAATSRLHSSRALHAAFHPVEHAWRARTSRAARNDTTTSRVSSSRAAREDSDLCICFRTATLILRVPRLEKVSPASAQFFKRLLTLDLSAQTTRQRHICLAGCTRVRLEQPGRRSIRFRRQPAM